MAGQLVHCTEANGRSVIKAMAPEVMEAIRKSRKNNFKEAAIVSHWHDFKAMPIKTTNSHVFSFSRALFYDYLG